jgi:hypothetical protein
MSIESHLYQAQAALSFLRHITCYYDNNATIPPDNFGFGLSVILDYINDDVTAAYNEYTKPEEKAE